MTDLEMETQTCDLDVPKSNLSKEGVAGIVELVYPMIFLSIFPSPIFAQENGGLQFLSLKSG